MQAMTSTPSFASFVAMSVKLFIVILYSGFSLKMSIVLLSYVTLPWLTPTGNSVCFRVEIFVQLALGSVVVAQRPIAKNKTLVEELLIR